MAPRRSKRGRPVRTLGEHPQQWDLVFLVRGIHAAAAEDITPLQTISDYVTWQYILKGMARPRRNDNLESIRRGRNGFSVEMTKLSPKLLKMKKKLEKGETGYDFDSANVFRPEIISMEKKLARIRKTDPDGLRVRLEICDLYLAGRIGKARQLAASIGETENFERELCRILGWVTVRFGHPFGQTIRHTITF